MSLVWGVWAGGIGEALTAKENRKKRRFGQVNLYWKADHLTEKEVLNRKSIINNYFLKVDVFYSLPAKTILMDHPLIDTWIIKKRGSLRNAL